MTGDLCVPRMPRVPRGPRMVCVCLCVCASQDDVMNTPGALAPGIIVVDEATAEQYNNKEEMTGAEGWDGQSWRGASNYVGGGGGCSGWRRQRSGGATSGGVTSGSEADVSSMASLSSRAVLRQRSAGSDSA